MMKNKIQKSFSLIFKRTVSLVLIFQLSISPGLTFAESTQKSLEKVPPSKQAQSFNKSVQSLRRFIFKDSSSKDFHYKNHPLDHFGLLGQETYLEVGRSIKRLHRIFRKNKNNPERLIEKLKVEAEHQASKVYSSKPIEPKNLIVEITKDIKNPKAEQIMTNSPQITLKSLRENLEGIRKSHTDFTLEVNEILSHLDTLKRTPRVSSSYIRATLSHKDQGSLPKQVLNEKVLSAWKPDSVFINTSREKLNFRLAYHQDSIQTLPQNIKWMAFFDNYLVFLEPPKVSDSKALISFIDLNYFKKAMGRTALPLFQIPVHFEKTNTTAKSLLSPKELKIENSQLTIGDLVISKDQLNYLSSLQQMGFNTIVSLLKNDETSKELLREIAKTYKKSLSKNYSEFNQGGQNPSLSEETRKMVLKFIENRRDIGSAQNVSGNFGRLSNLSARLKSESPMAKEFKESLIRDRAFQGAVSQTHNQLYGENGIWSRWIAFFNHLSRPQPLGAPHIKKALGLIAGSVSLPEDSVDSRFQAFKEGLKQSFYPRKNRYLTGTVLLGVGMLASPETAQYTLQAMEGTISWMGNLWELMTVTGKQSFTWVNPKGVYEAYFEGNKTGHFLIGVSALAAFILTVMGTSHLTINSFIFASHMRSKKEARHRKRVQGLFNQFRHTKRRFVHYMEKNRSDFINNLSNAEKKKLGLTVSMDFGLKNINSKSILKTKSSLQSLESALKSRNKISLSLNASNGDKTFIIDFQSVPNPEDSLKSNQISLSLDSKEETGQMKRVFATDQMELLKNLLDLEKGQMKSDISMSLEMSGKNLHISGILERADFTDKENQRLADLLKRIEKETGKSFLSSSRESTNNGEIKTLRQALAHLSLGYASWSNTFRATGLAWNKFFFARSMLLSPTTMVKLLTFSKYLKVITEDGHIPTVFNGGAENHLSRFYTKLKGNTSFEELNAFESKIIDLEKAVLKEVMAQSYVEVVKLAGESLNSKILSQPAMSLDADNIKDSRIQTFYAIHKRDLFSQVMKDYLSHWTGIDQKKGNSELKFNALKKFVENKKALNEPNEKLIKKLVEQRSPEVSEKSLKITDNLVTGFLKRRQVKNQLRNNRVLNPNKNIQMKRAFLGKSLLNDPEALARATRESAAEYTVDFPLNLLFTFLVLAGIDQGVLKILHDQPFTEEAWFHLSRFVIWSSFMTDLVLTFLSGVWMKVQMDSRLDETGGFENVPTEKEAKSSYLKWIWKQFQSEDNSLWANYKFVTKLTWANMIPALVTISIAWGLTLGRFDLELFLALYLAIYLLPYEAMRFKLENTFEKSANFSLKELIKRGLDLKNKDRKFLSHPDIQAIKIKESVKLRRKFNLWQVSLYDNPIGNIVGVFSNTHTPTLGSRAFTRMFTGGELATQHWVNFMDYLSEKNILPENLAEGCKKIFTNNRTDLQ